MNLSITYWTNPSDVFHENEIAVCKWQTSISGMIMFYPYHTKLVDPKNLSSDKSLESLRISGA